MNKNVKQIINFIKDKVSNDKLTNIIKLSNENYDYLVKKYQDDPKLLKKQTLNNMFPLISVYKALLANDIKQDDAFIMMKDFKAEMSFKSAKSTGKMLSLFGLYKLYPSIFKKVTDKSFNKDIGFDPHFVVVNKKQCKFDMKKCVFCDRCKAEGCFELVPAFCNTDIIFNSNLHKNIIWKRKSTLAEGAECCDFDVFLKEKDND